MTKRKLDFSKSRYSEEWLIKEIGKVQQALNIKHMPSRSECETVTKRTTLVNVIVRTGGFRFWANRLGLPMKNCETEVGYAYEIKAQEQLKKMGYKAELTPVKFPYDILVDDVTKIDVKASNLYHCPSGSSWYTFNLEAIFPKSDFLVAYCIENEAIKKTYVIPSHIMVGKSQLSLGAKTVYDKYLNKWELIEEHITSMKKIFD